MTAYLRVARACILAALAITAGCALLAVNRQWLAFGLILWLVPSLLLVAALARRAHIRSRQARVHDLQTRTSTTTWKDATTA